MQRYTKSAEQPKLASDTVERPDAPKKRSVAERFWETASENMPCAFCLTSIKRLHISALPA